MESKSRRNCTGRLNGTYYRIYSQDTSLFVTAVSDMNDLKTARQHAEADWLIFKNRRRINCSEEGSCGILGAQLSRKYSWNQSCMENTYSAKKSIINDAAGGCRSEFEDAEVAYAKKLITCLSCVYTSVAMH